MPVSDIQGTLRPSGFFRIFAASLSLGEKFALTEGLSEGQGCDLPREVGNVRVPLAWGYSSALFPVLRVKRAIPALWLSLMQVLPGQVPIA